MVFVFDIYYVFLFFYHHFSTHFLIVIPFIGASPLPIISLATELVLFEKSSTTTAKCASFGRRSTLLGGHLSRKRTWLGLAGAHGVRQTWRVKVACIAPVLRCVA